MNEHTSKVRLTQYSHGAGCGCKIAPAILDRILAGAGPSRDDDRLLVGNTERDDAAVYDLGDGTAAISTTDFFMPIVDDPVDFGRIAAVNAISDVYAMGGTPMVAIAILGWPLDKIAPEVAGQVLAGARLACDEAHIPLAGGHSIDSPEPIFGLAVTGRVAISGLKRNGGAKIGDSLFLTKGLGVGILTTAEKRDMLTTEHRSLARDSMVRLNAIGAELSELADVHAMTDVTGFGLLGHLCEMCTASGASARLNFEAVPLLHPHAVRSYRDAGCVPGGTRRNWQSYGHHIGPITESQRDILCDPQTSGGLLIAVDPNAADAVGEKLRAAGLCGDPIGTIVAPREHRVVVDGTPGG